MLKLTTAPGLRSAALGRCRFYIDEPARLLGGRQNGVGHRFLRRDPVMSHDCCLQHVYYTHDLYV